MIKRISRSALALVAAGLLVSPFVAQTANAQTITINPGQISATAKFNPATPPAGVTGVSVTYNCKNYFTGALVNQPGGSVGVPATGSTLFGNATMTPTSGAFITNIGLQAQTTTGLTGTSCVIQATMQGTANVGTPAITINVGGTDRTTTAGTATNAAGTAGAVTATTAELPVFTSTDVVITVTFPTVSVRKVVLGDEATAGAAYPMTINCYNQRGAFLATVAGTYALGDLVVSGAGSFITVFTDPDAFGSPTVRWYIYDALSTSTPVPAGVATFGGTTNAVLGLAGTISGLSAPRLAAVLAAANAARVQIPVAPNTAAGFTGAFTLVGGAATRVFTNNEFPGLNGGGVCEVTETNSLGMPVTLYSSTTATAGVTLAGTTASGAYRSALTAMGQTVTVTNASYGDLVVSKVVTGDPKTNIATYEVSVSCDKGGPKDTFLLKDRQSKVYQNIVSGTNCLVTETKSDGATPSYADNSGDNTTDGRVVIKRKGTGCAQVGAPTGAAPGGPAPTSAFDECWANVIITNSYVVATTTTAAPAVTTAAPTTAAPAPAPSPAPAPEVIDEPTFTG